MKQLKVALLLLVAAASFFGGGWLLRRGMGSGPVVRPAPLAPQAGSRLFEEVFRHVRSFAVDSMDEGTIYGLATTGVLTELGDPYAALLTPRDTGSLERPAERPPLGLYLDLLDDYVTVVSVVPGSPGAQANVQAGDVILRVGESSTDRLRPEAVARLLRGAPHTSVRLRIDRPTARTPIWVTIARGEVPDLPAPSVDWLADDIAHLKVFRIDSAALGKAREVLQAARSAGGRAVVLDLRGVVEGTLEEGIALAAQFLDRGETVVTSRGRVESDTTSFAAPGSESDTELAVVVLVDRGTSGAAEVVAGALQDHDRAAIVGEPTFGRGARQTLFPMGNGYLLRLTTSYWLTPSGRVIQRPPPSPAELLEPEDSAPPRPKFRTEGGRTVLGGGGIVPDREVALGREEQSAGDPALALARQLLVRAKDRRTLIAQLELN